MILTNYFIRKKIRKLATKSAYRKHASCSWSDVHHILFLGNAADREVLTDCVKQLREEGKSVDLCLYYSSKEAKQLGDDATVIPIVEGKNIGSFAYPEKNLVERLNKLPVDLLLDLTHVDAYTMKYLLLQHPCLFKVGIKQGNNGYYDFTIASPEDGNIALLFRHLLFYLHAIRTK